MFSPTVTVLYEHSVSGRNSLAVAFDLLAKLKSKDLKVVIPQPAELGAEANKLSASRLASSLEASVRSTGITVSVESIAQASQRLVSQASQSLIVSSNPIDDFEFILDKVNLLVSFDEEKLDGRGSGPLVFPFGSGESGWHAAQFALPLAQAMGLPVEFYHTTWTDPARPDVPPADQMCAAAIELRRKLEERAASLGIKFNTTVETADDVAEGLIRFSLRKGACLIAMARGRNTRAGSYVTQLLEQSPIPLVICGRPEGGTR
jgi:nucleotide-binding universal stress UspA family protein